MIPALILFFLSDSTSAKLPDSSSVNLPDSTSVSLPDSSSVNIRALVSEDMNRAALHSHAFQQKSIIHQLFGLSHLMMVAELGLIFMMAVLFVMLVVHFRKAFRMQREKMVLEKDSALREQQVISRSEIERILNQIATEKSGIGAVSRESIFVTHEGKLDSKAVINELARSHGLESERLNFAISFASQYQRKDGSRFKDAFALVNEGSDLNVLARQLNMGKGELELILALKKTKVANSRRSLGAKGGNAK